MRAEVGHRCNYLSRMSLTSAQCCNTSVARLRSLIPRSTTGSDKNRWLGRMMQGSFKEKSQISKTPYKQISMPLCPILYKASQPRLLLPLPLPLLNQGQHTSQYHHLLLHLHDQPSPPLKSPCQRQISSPASVGPQPWTVCSNAICACRLTCRARMASVKLCSLSPTLRVQPRLG